MTTKVGHKKEAEVRDTGGRLVTIPIPNRMVADTLSSWPGNHSVITVNRFSTNEWAILAVRHEGAAVVQTNVVFSGDAMEHIVKLYEEMKKRIPVADAQWPEVEVPDACALPQKAK